MRHHWVFISGFIKIGHKLMRVLIAYDLYILRNNAYTGEQFVEWNVIFSVIRRCFCERFIVIKECFENKRCSILSIGVTFWPYFYIITCISQKDGHLCHKNTFVIWYTKFTKFEGNILNDSDKHFLLKIVYHPTILTFIVFCCSRSSIRVWL